MGEHAKYNGSTIKIGTCESMYYLRADQQHLVQYDGSWEGVRFRFPFPDEDTIQPGEFEDYNRSLAIPGAPLPDEFDHSTIVFTASSRANGHNKYTVSLPCPEVGNDGAGSLKVRKVGGTAQVHIVQQRYWEGLLVVVCECAGCGAAYRLPTWADAEPLVVAVRSVADGCERSGDKKQAKFYHEVADRITAGYNVQPEPEYSEVEPEPQPEPYSAVCRGCGGIRSEIEPTCTCPEYSKTQPAALTAALLTLF